MVVFSIEALHGGFRKQGEWGKKIREQGAWAQKDKKKRKIRREKLRKAGKMNIFQRKTGKGPPLTVPRLIK